MKFKDINLSNELSSAIDKFGFEEATQIQAESIPHIMKGKDVIGESATGSGKTLAFGCGIVEHAVPGKGVQALVLTPTRELAEQVKKVLVQLSSTKRLRVTSIYGGVSIGPQIDDLERADVVVATPGRLLDHMQRRTINMSNLKVLVLDEADRMFDMGFIEDVEKIISQCPKKRQALFFSATISQKINDLANRHMVNPVNIYATKMVDPSKLKQVYYDVSKNAKLTLLLQLYTSDKAGGLAMVFCNTRRSTDFVVKNLKANKVDAIAIHGGLTQNKRTKTIDLFNKGRVGVLVCTDVAARGLHIDNVSHIYNFDIPNDPTDYVHRIGRTARAGEEGEVINLLCDYDYDNFSRIKNEHRDFNIDRLESPKVTGNFVIKKASQGHGGNGRGRYSGRGNPRGGSRGGRGPSHGRRGPSNGRRGPSRGRRNFGGNRAGNRSGNSDRARYNGHLSS